MSNEQGFKFKQYMTREKYVYWNPDRAQNGHIMITGGSGAGKTRLAKDLMAYLYESGKNIHVIDVQNTLSLEGKAPERLFDFEVRNSPYSINPFEFLRDTKDGGPHAQIDDVMNMFQKTFIKTLNNAPAMSAVLRRLIVDTYKKANIIDEDINTWGLELTQKEFQEKLPIIADMKELVDYILDFVSGGYGAKFGSIMAKNGKAMNEWHLKKMRLEDELKKLEEVADRDVDRVKKERNRINSELADLQDHIYKNSEKLISYFVEYLNYSFLGGDVPTYEALLDESEDNYAWLDFKFYADKDRIKTIKTIETYLAALNSAGVFGRSTPAPSFTEVNRYNLASINDKARLFCADTIVAKIFRMVYLRGEYKSLPEGNMVYKNRRPNSKTDTVIVIDEMQTLLPDKQEEAKNKNLLYNKVISQIRNFGGMMVAMSQTPANFPDLFHTNTATKIILHTEASDIAKVKAITGIKDNALFQHLEHTNSQGNYDVGLMKDRVGNWVSVEMPWFEETKRSM